MPRVLYLGDHRGGSARYLLGALKWAGMPHAHHDRAEKPPKLLVDGKSEWDVVILSDYSAKRLGPRADASLAELVSGRGVGLIMLGGWESFTGKSGGYRGTAVAGVLPVKVAAEDDRRNLPTGMVIWPAAAHPLVDGINFRRPPAVVGYNAVTPRQGAQILLNGFEIRIRGKGKTPAVEIGSARPMLVVGESGQGRTAAFATDLAPHWCGGMVDWGRGRVEVAGIEVGEIYLEFILRLITWTAGSLRTSVRKTGRGGA